MIEKREPISPDEVDLMALSFALFAHGYRHQIDGHKRIFRRKHLRPVLDALERLFNDERALVESSELDCVVQGHSELSRQVEGDLEMTWVAQSFFVDAESAEDHLFIDEDYNGEGDDRDKAKTDGKTVNPENAQPAQRAKASVQRIIGVTSTRAIEKRIAKVRKRGAISGPFLGYSRAGRASLLTWYEGLPWVKSDFPFEGSLIPKIRSK